MAVDEKKLHATTDASVWAAEFCNAFHITAPTPYGKGAFVLPQDEAEGLMIGWFANAIEVGRTAGASEATALDGCHPAAEDAVLDG